jgi:SSS family solute:Na+ symporter
MMMFFVSAVSVIAAFCVLGVISSGGVRSASDYAVSGRRAGGLSVAGIITGALVAGGSTIGTVQMAYIGGLSAWWFTLGSGIGCAILGMRFAGPLRRTGLSTLPELIERNFGYPTALVTLSGSVLGTLISVVTQFQAGTALLGSLVPISGAAAAAVISVMIMAFIFAGGLKSYSSVGNAKTAALCLLLAACCAAAAINGQTPAVILREMPARPWFSPFGFGIGKGLGACFSLIVGILCTQIYVQALFAASGEREARRGCIISAILIPPLGLMGIWIGLAMRNAGIEVEPAQALPFFIMNFFHPAVSGALWACLAIAIVGGASGLCLGIATNISMDIYARISGADREGGAALAAGRGAVLLTVAVTASLAVALKSSLILHLSYIGMGLRGSSMAVPLLALILRPGALSRRAAFAAASCGLAGMLAAWVAAPQIEPLFIGLPASAAAAVIFQLIPGKRG